jgi:hypothetical protein
VPEMASGLSSRGHASRAKQLPAAECNLPAYIPLEAAPFLPSNQSTAQARRQNDMQVKAADKQESAAQQQRVQRAAWAEEQLLRQSFQGLQGRGSTPAFARVDPLRRTPMPRSRRKGAAVRPHSIQALETRAARACRGGRHKRPSTSPSGSKPIRDTSYAGALRSNRRLSCSMQVTGSRKPTFKAQSAVSTHHEPLHKTCVSQCLMQRASSGTLRFTN